MALKTRKISFVSLWAAALVLVLHAVVPHHHHWGKEYKHHECHQFAHADEMGAEEDAVLHIEHETARHEKCNECPFKTDASSESAKKQQKVFVNDQFLFQTPLLVKYTNVWLNESQNSYISQRYSSPQGRAPPQKI